LEQSRALLEKEGVHLAAISYDSVETLRDFAEKYHVEFPLLSDRDSAAIRAFGILNNNIAAGLRAHGVPHPVEYLVSGDGVVVRKYFVPNYQHRVTGSDIALREFGAVAKDAPAVTLQSGAVTIAIGLSTDKAFAGQELGYFARFRIESGWHIYDSSSVVFDDASVASQTFRLPPATESLHSGSFQGIGELLLKFPLATGPLKLRGRVHFQQCGESVCEPPESLTFELTVTLGTFVVATPTK
jgi:hypothetical protein